MDSSIHQHFSCVRDPRIDRQKKHPLINVIFIAICGVLCGTDNWVAIERFAKVKEEWLGQFLDLSHGIPSHDTFNRTFAALDNNEFTECFIGWLVEWVGQQSKGDSID